MTKRPLTHSQKKALEFLKNYVKTFDCFPTRRQMAEGMPTTLSNVQRMIDGLVKAKAIYRLPGSGNSLNGVSRLSFEPFDAELVLLETPYKPIEIPRAKVIIFLNEESKFTSFDYSGNVEVSIKRSK